MLSPRRPYQSPPTEARSGGRPVAVAEREVAARGSAVAAEARALVEHQVGPARGRENRPRGLPAVGMAEELIPAWEHHGDTLAHVVSPRGAPALARRGTASLAAPQPAD